MRAWTPTPRWNGPRGAVFTTRTPVPASIEGSRELIVDQFSNFDMPLDRVLALGA
jgi:hypothetical protein